MHKWTYDYGTCVLKLFSFHMLLKNRNGSLKNRSVLLFHLIVFFCKEKTSKTLGFGKSITDHGEWNCKNCHEWEFLFHERDWAGALFWQGTRQDHERIGAKTLQKLKQGQSKVRWRRLRIYCKMTKNVIGINLIFSLVRATNALCSQLKTICNSWRWQGTTLLPCPSNFQSHLLYDYRHEITPSFCWKGT